MELDHHKFHHLGYATPNIEKEIPYFTRMGYELEGGGFSDETQGVRGCFMIGGGPRLELLENLPDSDTLTPWLDKGVKMYHFAYTVKDIYQSLDVFKSQGALVVVNPVPAIAFQFKKIAFVMLRNRQLVEIIEE